MSIKKFQRSVDEVLARLHAVPLGRRCEAFREELDKLPNSQERELVMLIVAAMRGLWEADAVVLASPSARPIIHHHNYGEGTTVEFMEDKTENNMTISGGSFSGPVGINQAFANCYNVLGSVQDSNLQQALKTLIDKVQEVHPHLSDDERGKAERRLRTLTEEAAQKTPDKEQIQLSGKGLIEAAKTCAAMAPPVIIAVKALAGLFGVALP